jgi:hypothetical protein
VEIQGRGSGPNACTKILSPGNLESLFEKLIGAQLLEKFPAFYGNPMIHYFVHTKAYYWTLPRIFLD